jgi:hypothetical protein
LSLVCDAAESALFPRFPLYRCFRLMPVSRGKRLRAPAHETPRPRPPERSRNLGAKKFGEPRPCGEIWKAVRSSSRPAAR